MNTNTHISSWVSKAAWFRFTVWESSLFHSAPCFSNLESNSRYMVISVFPLFIFFRFSSSFVCFLLLKRYTVAAIPFSCHINSTVNKQQSSVYVRCAAMQHILTLTNACTVERSPRFHTQFLMHIETLIHLTIRFFFASNSNSSNGCRSYSDPHPIFFLFLEILVPNPFWWTLFLDRFKYLKHFLIESELEWTVQFSWCLKQYVSHSHHQKMFCRVATTIANRLHACNVMRLRNLISDCVYAAPACDWEKYIYIFDSLTLMYSRIPFILDKKNWS